MSVFDHISAESAGISIWEAEGQVVLYNRYAAVAVNLTDGTYAACRLSDRQVIVQQASFSVNDYSSTRDGGCCSYTAEGFSDELGEGQRVRVKAEKEGEPTLFLTIGLYEDSGRIVLCTGLQNTMDRAIQVREMKPLDGRAYAGWHPEHLSMLDGNGGAFETRVLHEGELCSRNNGLLAFTEKGQTRALVLGGLSYEDFAKYVKILPEEDGAKLSLYAEDPYGRLTDPGSLYFPEKDRYYLDFTTDDPFAALEVYARALRLAQHAVPNAYHFPSVCMWYAEFYDMLNHSKEKINTSAGAVEQMRKIAQTGFLKYSPVAVRLVPDYYGLEHRGGNLQQGWWDDAHWQKYQDPVEGNGKYVPPYETTEKWAGAVTELGGIPLSYLQTSVISQDYAEALPEHTLFNAGNYRENEWLNGSYSPEVGYDFTDPGFEEHLRTVYSHLRQAGLRGLMFDYPGTAWDVQGGFEDPHATTARNYRNVFRIAKENLGPDSWIDERGFETGLDLTLGYVDSQRTEDDTADMPPEMVARCGLRWYKNRVVTNYDMDSKDLMRAQSLDELRTLVTMAYVVSGRLLLANGFENLDTDTRYVLSRTYPQHAFPQSFRPVDAFVRDGAPEVYALPVPDGRVIVVFYNGDRQHGKTVSVPLSAPLYEGGLELDPAATYEVYDFWNDRYVGRIAGNAALAQHLRKGESRVFSLCRAAEQPLFLSDNRHILQGVVETRNLEWKDGCLSGMSDLVAEEDFVLTVKLPDGKHYTAQLDAEGCSCQVQWNRFDQIIRAVLVSRENRTVRWQLRLQEEQDSEPPVPLEQNCLLQAMYDTENYGVILRWRGQPGCRYQVHKSSQPGFTPSPLTWIGETAENQYTDYQADNGRLHYYRLVIQNTHGQAVYSCEASCRVDFINPVLVQEPDRVTGGQWVGHYGRSGYSLRGFRNTGHLERLPDYIEKIECTGTVKYLQAEGLETVLLSAPDGRPETGAGYDSSTGILQYTIHAKDHALHRMTLYMADYPQSGFGIICKDRRMAVDIKTPAGQIFAEQISVEDFKQGMYLSFTYQGSVTLTIHNQITLGLCDAVCSGIFFDEPDAADGQ